jgi:hypothetical protein
VPPFAENFLPGSYAKAMPMSLLLALRTHGLPTKALFVARERLRQRFGNAGVNKNVSVGKN